MARIDITADGDNSAALPTTGVAGNSVLVSDGNTLACFLINMSGATIDATIGVANGSEGITDYDGLYDMAGGSTTANAQEVRGVYNIDVKRIATLHHTSGPHSGSERAYRVKVQPGATFSWTTQADGADVHIVIGSAGDLTAGHETGATFHQDVWVVTNQ